MVKHELCYLLPQLNFVSLNVFLRYLLLGQVDTEYCSDLNTTTKSVDSVLRQLNLFSWVDLRVE